MNTPERSEQLREVIGAVSDALRTVVPIPREEYPNDHIAWLMARDAYSQEWDRQFRKLSAEVMEAMKRAAGQEQAVAAAHGAIADYLRRKAEGA